MNEKPPTLLTKLVSELREALNSGKGNYGHRLLCGKAAEEIKRLRTALNLIAGDAKAQGYFGIEQDAREALSGEPPQPDEPESPK